MGLWLRRGEGAGQPAIRHPPLLQIVQGQGASNWAMSTRVSSVALRTPGLISSTKISSTNQAARAKISTRPHSSCNPILISSPSRCPAHPEFMPAPGCSPARGGSGSDWPRSPAPAAWRAGS